MPEIDASISALMMFILTSSIITPFVAMLINRPEWATPIRQGVAAAVAVVVAVAVLLLTGGIDSLAQGATTILMVLGLSTLAYDALWKPTGVATAVEALTSPKQIASE